MDLNNVVLPQPEGPRKERIPLSNSNDTLSKAVRSLNRLVTPSTFKIDISYGLGDARERYAGTMTRPHMVVYLSQLRWKANLPTRGFDFARPGDDVAYSSILFSLSALVMTDTELNVIAALAIIGFKSTPKNG